MQREDNALEIVWYGLSCFRLTERGRVTVITDPYQDNIGLPPLKLKGEVVTISHDSRGHNNIDAVKPEPYVLRGAGEYEIGNVFITGIAMHDTSGATAQPNVAYMIDYDNLRVLHLGDLSHVPNQSVIEAMNDVRVVLVPVGGGKGLSAAKAAEVVGMIEPSFIVPMHYQTPDLGIELDDVDKFLKAMGVSKVDEQDTLKVLMGDVPDQPQVVVLRPQV
jgi:L-ascorbate metabolism protein UlaG (beta-lactamase superfamily)